MKNKGPELKEMKRKLKKRNEGKKKRETEGKRVN
jgi:hypothetical protein